MRAILPLIVPILLVDPCFRALPIHSIETLAGKFLLPVTHIQKILPGIGHIGKLRHIADLIRAMKEGVLVLEYKALPVIASVNGRLCIVRFPHIVAN